MRFHEITGRFSGLNTASAAIAVTFIMKGVVRDALVFDMVRALGPGGVTV